ncbi:MAG: phage tail sheath family protein [Deltaproteobacteria bacterium]|nr:phage tail sheath family protein [Deltaproteobacteria bacterium]
MQMRPPGVYIEREEHRDFSLGIGRTGIPAFLAITTRGPLNQPVQINSFKSFCSIFGERVPGGYSYDSVKAFFDNGGRECVIVRIARTEARGSTERATTAGVLVKDRKGTDTVGLFARNEGTWGNEITVEVVNPPPTAQTFLTADLGANECSCVVKSARGFARGTIVRIHDGESEAYVTLVRVEAKTLHWAPSEVIPRRFRAATPTYLEPMEFEIRAASPEVKEVFSGLSFSLLSERHFERSVNALSQLIRVEDFGSPHELPLCLPVNLPATRLSGGMDGIANIGPDDFVGFNSGPNERKGLGALDEVDEIDLLLAPDLMYALQHSSRFRSLKDVEAVQEALVANCEKWRNRFAILDSPPSFGYEQALQWRMLFDSSYGGLYYPWIKIESRGQQLLIPPSGFVAGVIAKNDRIGVHHPPANVLLEGAIDLEILLNDAHLGHLNAEGVNCIRYFPNRGIRIWGARTLASDAQWKYVNVRRIMTMLVRVLQEGTQWVVFEPNEPSLWSRVTLNVAEFLDRLHGKGYFQGDTKEQGYYVKCDAETNPPEVRDAGVLIMEIGVAPVRPAEFLVFRIKQTLEDQGAESNEG